MGAGVVFDTYHFSSTTTITTAPAPIMEDTATAVQSPLACIDGGGAEGGMNVMVFGGGRPIQLPGPLKTGQASTEMGFKWGHF